MLSTRILTTHDLDVIGCTFLEHSLDTAAKLVEAVDGGLIADPDDTGYALILAAELTARDGDLQVAEVLAKRAVEAYRSYEEEDCYPRLFHAGLLVRLGREADAMAALTALRPLLSENCDAVTYVREALEEGGHAELAEQWLTEALAIALQRWQSREPQREQEGYQRPPMVLITLGEERHRLRRGLGLPHDEHDHLAEQMLAELEEARNKKKEEDDPRTVVLFWPQPEFHYLLRRWPVLVEEYGDTWEGYRTPLQSRLFRGLRTVGEPRLALFAGAVDDLADYAEREGRDPTDPEVRQDYAQHLAAHQEETIWPPGRSLPCWCGSGLRYNKCCLPPEYL